MRSNRMGSFGVNQVVTGVALSTLLFSSHGVAEHAGVSEPLLETVVVTATREKSSLANTAASVGVLGEKLVQEVLPTHSSELLNRIPGVNIVQLGSSAEGTAAAIRQPISYGPVYLYLENGVPTRSAGFFNHNALYGMNVGVSNGVEVIKGPGSALYGSDAIGAVINLISGQPPKEDEASVGIEVGEDGWRRAQLRGALLTDDHGFTARLDVKEYDGWRDHTGSERQSFTGSWNTDISDDLKVNTVLTVSNLDYDTGGSGLTYDDYKNDTERAGNLIAFRKATAYRLSSAFDKQLNNGVFTVTPFFRSNDLEYIAHWTLRSSGSSPDAHINRSGHDSAGVLLKYHHDLNADSFFITGIDLDYSQGYVDQNLIVRTGDLQGEYWLAYEEAHSIYDFEVDFYSASPYVHFETQTTERLRLSAGLRYDNVRYEYDNNLTESDQSPHKRLASQSVNMDHLSPKLSAIYQFNDDLNGYAAYRHAFRIPSASQLFRSGKTDDSSNLDPVKVDSYEIGLRGQLHPTISFDSTLYYMTKKDDIISVNDADGRRNVNAGETKHYGVELGVDMAVSDTVDFLVAYTRAKHRFEDWKDGKNDYSGNDIPLAPRDFGNVRLQYRPALLNGGRLEVEWIHQGEHWIDNKNEDSTNDRAKYDGHDLVNLRGDYWATEQLNLYVRALNVADKLYAETTNEYGKYTPGRSRTVYAGFRYEL